MILFIVIKCLQSFIHWNHNAIILSIVGLVCLGGILEYTLVFTTKMVNVTVINFCVSWFMIIYASRGQMLGDRESYHFWSFLSVSTIAIQVGVMFARLYMACATHMPTILACAIAISSLPVSTSLTFGLIFPIVFRRAREEWLVTYVAIGFISMLFVMCLYETFLKLL